MIRSPLSFSELSYTQVKFEINENCFSFIFSASGTSAVAIDNKIEQAMVSNLEFLLYFILFIILVSESKVSAFYKTRFSFPVYVSHSTQKLVFQSR